MPARDQTSVLTPPSSHSACAGVPVQFVGGNKLMLRATCFGDSNAPVVLLLHGGGQTRHAWSDTGQALAAAGYYAIAVDARGHGESDWCAQGDYSAGALVSDLRSILESLPSVPYIVGASMGGLTAMLTLGENPQLACCGLILVDVAPRLEHDGVRRIVEFMRRHSEGFDSIEQVLDAVSAYSPRRQAPKSPHSLYKNLRQGPNGRLYWHWDPAFLDHAVVLDGDRGDGDMFGLARLNKAASGLNLPVLLIRGFHSDVLSEQGAQELLAQIPQSCYRVLDQAGHMMTGDLNSIFTDTVLDFLNDLNKSGCNISLSPSGLELIS